MGDSAAPSSGTDMGVDDMIKLGELSEENILKNLEVRYLSSGGTGNIYHWCLSKILAIEFDMVYVIVASAGSPWILSQYSCAKVWNRISMRFQLFRLRPFENLFSLS